MNKFKFLVVVFVMAFFSSCVMNKEGDNSSSTSTENEKKDDDTQNNPSSEIITEFKNSSAFDVNVYYGTSPYAGNRKIYLTVLSGKSSKTDFYGELSNDSRTFYIEYLLKIGNVTFPYYSMDSSINHKSLVLKKGINNIEIGEIHSCETNSAFLLIENNTDNDLKLLAGISIINSFGSTDDRIHSKSSAVFETGDRSQLAIENVIRAKLDYNSENIDMPQIQYASGNIYTISVNTDEKGVSTASLKAVTPFNIDTQNKIWSLDNSIFSTEYPVAMRPSYDGKATLVIGTAHREPQKIGIGRIDEYGKYSTGTDNFVAFNNNPNHTETQIVDFVEQQDGSVVMLCNQIFKTDDIISENYVIVCYDFASKTPKWYKVIPSSVQVSAEDNSCYMLVFRNDSKNKLIQIGENKFICVGAYDHFAYNTEGDLDYDRLHYMIMYVDGTTTDSEGAVVSGSFKTIISKDYTDLAEGIERNLTSAYFDGTDLFICGYDNWEHADYSTTHIGKIWKVPLSDIEAGNYDFENNVVYSRNNCLFFSIDGTGKNYVVCGEYKDKGKVLKGCHVTSSMIKADSSCTPVKYTGPGKQSCWFNQLCQYGSKIVLCGKAADSFDGSESPLPFVVAYDSKGNKLWENLSFTNYTSALNIIPNTIGTYMLQLEGKNGIIHYVNADLLGNEKK